MLTENQIKYINSIPENKITQIKPFDPRAKQTGNELVQVIKQKMPELEVLFMGATELGIAGQNDIDLNVLSSPEEYEKYLPLLKELFGEPIKSSPNLIKWEFVRNGFDVELYLTDKNSSLLREQIKTFELLQGNPELLKEYEAIKLASDGLFFREYMKRKYEFFNKLPR